MYSRYNLKITGVVRRVIKYAREIIIYESEKLKMDLEIGRNTTFNKLQLDNKIMRYVVSDIFKSAFKRRFKFESKKVVFPLTRRRPIFALFYFLRWK